MITSSQARLIINDHVRAFIAENPIKVQFPNDSSFKPPQAEDWCRVTVQYSDPVAAGLYKGILQRDYGIISIQCFAPKGYGDKSLIELADKWRDHWQGFRKPFFEVTLVSAPTPEYSEVSDLYSMSLVRVQFRVN